MTYAEVLIRKGKRGAAAFVQAECSNSTSGGGDPSRSPQHLNALLDHLLHPEKNIDDQETIDWCQSLVGGGKTYEEFVRCVKEYDSTAMCGLVWTADFMAYRCRTCGISQCMSLCAECFKDGNHEGHDFNMFKSQAGGACDCGDSSVMRESGFCSRHHGSSRPANPPSDLICVAENLIPRIVLRLLQHLRINTIPSTLNTPPLAALQKYETVIKNANKFLKLLHDFSSLGAAMRSVMTKCLIDQPSYERLTNVGSSEDYEYSSFMRRSKMYYDDALINLPNPDPPTELQDYPALTAQLEHKTFLEELVFWTVKYEFPEELVCLLLKMLPDTEYKEAFTRSFVLHYSRVSMMLVRSSNSDKLSNRIVHVSVQLFSNEDLALSMTERLSLLHIMVSSLKNMMNNVLIPSGLHSDGEDNDKHKVVDCSQHVMKHHCYWPLVSDLNNVLSHPPIAFRFMSDNRLLTMWFDFLKTFQGMNLNFRIVGQHIEFEPNTYYASFSGELEASASPMWALVSHLRDPFITRVYTANVITHCLRAIQEWMEAISFRNPNQINPQKASFHLPLHRYFSVFLRQAVKHQGFTLKELLPHPYMLSLLMMHPLRVQTAFYEIMSGLWVRNGLQIKGQAMTYIQCHFCKSMVDADLFLLQVCSTQLPANSVLKTILDSFQITDWLSLSPGPPAPGGRVYRDKEQELQMIDACLVFLVSILTLRTNLGLSEEELARLEMVSLLCMGDRTHSALHEHMPEKCGTSVPLELFDSVLSEVAQYSEPRFEAGGNMQQGMYLPKPHVWEHLYDPIYVLLRAVHRREFQMSIERYNAFAKERFENGYNLRKSVMSPWPPWRLPSDCDPGFEDPRKMLHSKYAHGLIFNLLHKAVHGPVINDLITSLSVHLLELALTFPQTNPNAGREVAVSKPWGALNEQPIDLQYDTWYPTDCLSANLRHNISVVLTRDTVQEGAVAGGAGGLGDGTEIAQSMEIDQVSDVSDTETVEPYKIETPSSEGSSVGAGGNPVVAAIRNETENASERPALPYTQPLAITGPAVAAVTTVSEGTSMELEAEPPASGSGEVVPWESLSHGAVASTSSGASRMVRQRRSASSSTAKKQRGVVAVNESIITLLLKLHSKYFGRADSYVPLGERKGFATSQKYRESRVGDACFFIEKALDRICELDSDCAANVEAARRELWPNLATGKAAERDSEREREEMMAKKRRARAKEHQRQVMEQLAQQRKRFMENMESSGLMEAISAETTTATPAADASTSSNNEVLSTSRTSDEEASEPIEESGGGNPSSRPFFRTGLVNLEEVIKSKGKGKGSDRSEGGLGKEGDGSGGELQRRPVEYTCCHCLQQQPASEEKPIGLVTLIQSTSVLAHKHSSKKHLVLPTSADEEEALPEALRSSLGHENEQLFDQLSESFNRQMALVSMNKGVKCGVHVQSCGHHMHYDCRQSYCETLKQQGRVSRDQPLDTERGEFICPVCRQLANSLLPIPPEEIGLPVTLFPHNEFDRMTAVANSIYELLKEDTIDVAPGSTPLRVEMGKIVEFVTKTTFGSNFQQSSVDNLACPNNVIANMLSSIARTNLELDLVQRGGSFVGGSSSSSAGVTGVGSTSAASLCKTKFCFAPLIHVLSIHMKVMAPKIMFQCWGMLTGHAYTREPVISNKANDIPLLMQDPLALMLHYVLLLPFNIDIAYFLTIVKACYNLSLTRTLMRMTATSMTRGQRRHLQEQPNRSNFAGYLHQIVDYLESTTFYDDEGDAGGGGNTFEVIDFDRLEREARQQMMPFLRISALVKHYLFHQPLPKIVPDEKSSSDRLELLGLLEYLEILPPTSGGPMEEDAAEAGGKLDEDDAEMKASGCDASVAGGFSWFLTDSRLPADCPISEMDHWLKEYHAYSLQNRLIARSALDVKADWEQPSLLRVPKNFEQIFQYYHKRKCKNCDRVPKDPTVCMMCGTFLCLKESCCRQQSAGPNSTGACETVAHSIECGGGTGIFLAVNSSTIVVIRGKRACIWGSIYLDVFGEEDRDLRRGKPLFLHPERFQLLEHQWLTHKFDHTSRRWVFHKDAL